MSNPLFNGTEQESIFKATVEIPPLPPGKTLDNVSELREFIEKAVINISSENALFGYSSGPISNADADDRDKPRFIFDDEARFIGIGLFIPEIQNWSLSGVIGEIKTVSRSESTVVLDIQKKILNGWFLCDGTTPGAPDLTPKEVTDDGGKKHFANPGAFFTGSAPDWDIYSVIKIA